MLYEDANLKRKALELIPVQALKDQARVKYESYLSTKDANPFDLNDFLVIELLAWFKNEFFRWTNQPDCDMCNTNQNVKFKTNDKPNRDEIPGMAGNVEVYEYE
jgi:peptide-N4-(N-acetyl-beta-glucosaminyl)asparagine amidase